jgi:hypothetical protein
MQAQFSCVTILLVAGLLQAPVPPQPVSPATFVGTWVGLQTVSQNTSPGIVEGQTVTLTIDVVGEKLVGTLTPFFGGSDGATFVDSQIVGEELRASAFLGRPPVSDSGGGRGGQQPAWKNDTKIQLTLRADRIHLTGTANVELGGVKWMQYNYDLEKKRSRY